MPLYAPVAASMMHSFRRDWAQRHGWGAATTKSTAPRAARAGHAAYPPVPWPRRRSGDDRRAGDRRPVKSHLRGNHCLMTGTGNCPHRSNPELLYAPSTSHRTLDSRNIWFSLLIYPPNRAGVEIGVARFAVQNRSARRPTLLQNGRLGREGPRGGHLPARAAGTWSKSRRGAPT